MLIAIEGIDGSGKGVQSKLLQRWLKEKGYDTVITKEPTDGAIGKVLRDALRAGDLDPKTEALLFAADRADHAKWIIERLEEGKLIVSERYIHSSLAYQGASGVSMEWVKELNRFAPLPDLVILLDISPAEGLKRIGSGNSLRSSMREKEHFERREFLTKVRAIYLDLAKEHKNMERIDASGSIEDVQTAIRRKVSRALSTLKGEEKKSVQKDMSEYF